MTKKTEHYHGIDSVIVKHSPSLNGKKNTSHSLSNSVATKASVTKARERMTHNINALEKALAESEKILPRPSKE